MFIVKYSDDEVQMCLSWSQANALGKLYRSRKPVVRRATDEEAATLSVPKSTPERVMQMDVGSASGGVNRTPILMI